MIIYTPHINTRLLYILNYVFNTKLGLSYKLTSKIDEFNKSNHPKINYSGTTIDNVFQIVPEGLLFEKNIRTEYPTLTQIDGLPIIFSHKGGDISFDIFSALFWFISRYEEYMLFKPDTHERFSATQSFAYKNGILNIPIVDEWIAYFRKQLIAEFADIELNANIFNAITTIDVDSPWCYKNKGLVRNSVGLLRDMAKFNFSNVVLRIKVLLNIKSDPWYSFSWLLKLHENTKNKLIFFIHVGNYGKYDKTVDYRLKAFSTFVKSISSKADIALHPSYKASTNITIFKEELSRLSKLTNKKIVSSRQHFLVFTLPNYYRMLLELDIKNDYSMGFADKTGFRAGTSGSFYFFDLDRNIQTELLIHPFAIMDRTLNSYEGENPEKAVKTVVKLVENVKKVNGTFISLWHNESLSDRFEWIGWRKVFINYFNIVN